MSAMGSSVLGAANETHMMWEGSLDYTSQQSLLPTTQYMGNGITEAPGLTLESLAADETMMDVTMSADEVDVWMLFD